MARVAGVINFAQSPIEGKNALSGEVFSPTGLIPSMVRVILRQSAKSVHASEVSGGSPLVVKVPD